LELGDLLSMDDHVFLGCLDLREEIIAIVVQPVWHAHANLPEYVQAMVPGIPELDETRA
jgi:hypothetical protein